MRMTHGVGSVEISDGARDTQDAVIAPRGQPETIGHAADERAAFGVGTRDLFDSGAFGILRRRWSSCLQKRSGFSAN